MTKRADLPAEHSSVRLMMFEVYEKDSDFPLVVCSDSTALTDLQPTDRVVRRHWVREGGADDLAVPLGNPRSQP